MYTQPSAPQDRGRRVAESGGCALSTTVSEMAQVAKSSSDNSQRGTMDLDAYQENLQLRAPQSYPDEGFRRRTR
ncbi:hypothetical protein BG005_004218 [Podila minutissima]|nr:hypothetical protein BG005_004218 [Podila minutissima]